jgi:hypothetical protein
MMIIIKYELLLLLRDEKEIYSCFHVPLCLLQ